MKLLLFFSFNFELNFLKIKSNKADLFIQFAKKLLQIDIDLLSSHTKSMQAIHPQQTQQKTRQVFFCIGSHPRDLHSLLRWSTKKQHIRNSYTHVPYTIMCVFEHVHTCSGCMRLCTSIYLLSYSQNLSQTSRRNSISYIKASRSYISPLYTLYSCTRTLHIRFTTSVHSPPTYIHSGVRTFLFVFFACPVPSRSTSIGRIRMRIGSNAARQSSHHTVSRRTSISDHIAATNHSRAKSASAHSFAPKHTNAFCESSIARINIENDHQIDAILSVSRSVRHRQRTLCIFTSSQSHPIGVQAQRRMGANQTWWSHPPPRSDHPPQTFDAQTPTSSATTGAFAQQPRRQRWRQS